MNGDYSENNIVSCINQHLKEIIKSYYDEVQSGKKDIKEIIESEKKKLAQKLTIKSKCCGLNLFRDYHDVILNNIESGLVRYDRYVFRKVLIKTSSKLTINRTGGYGVNIFEIGVSLHDIFGYPYIPGASLKGVSRFAMTRMLNLLTNDEETTNVIIKYIYGEKISNTKEKFLIEKGFTNYVDEKRFKKFSKGHISFIYFTDAYPEATEEDGYLLVPDILNPHYKPDVPDELSVTPLPLIHMVIPKGVTFKFLLGYSKDIINVLRFLNDNYPNVDFTSVDEFIGCLLEFMGILGIGAKTSVGYSKFEVISYG